MMVNASALGTAAYNVSWRYGDLSKRALAVRIASDLEWLLL